MMEEILKRMMAAEKEAAATVRAAQKEADAQVLDARRQAASLLSNREGAIEAACAELLKARGDVAYSLLDLGAELPESVVQRIAAMGEVMRVRVI